MDFVELVFDSFKKTYGIDLSKEKEINIDNMVFPNYCVQNILNLEYEKDYRDFEYCRIINKLFGFGYLKEKTSYYEEEGVIKIEPNDIVFDCGANTGIFSLYGAYKGKWCYAFEPSTLICHYLRNTQKYTNKISIVPYGLSNENKKEYFYQTDNPGAARFEEYHIPDYHKVLYRELNEVITINDFVRSTGAIPNFIKMDIEDAEVKAIEGAKETIKLYKPKCAISIHEANKDKFDYIKSFFPKEYKFVTKSAPFYDPVLLCYVGE